MKMSTFLLILLLEFGNFLYKNFKYLLVSTSVISFCYERRLLCFVYCVQNTMGLCKLFLYPTFFLDSHFNYNSLFHWVFCIDQHRLQILTVLSPSADLYVLCLLQDMLTVYVFWPAIQSAEESGAVEMVGFILRGLHPKFLYEV